MADKNSCALILLAAGASTRMGQPKQLLPIDGQPLLRQVASEYLKARVFPVIVVLGANAPQIIPHLDGLPLQIVINPAWTEGMGSSLRSAMEYLRDHHPELQQVIVALADQPDLSSEQIGKLIDAQRTTGRAIIASECDGIVGPPVLFTAKHFPALLKLSGDAGARGLLKLYADEVVAVALPSRHDLDTPEDYRAYSERKG